MEARLLDLFRLERDSRFLLLQRSFLLFEQTDLFPHLAPLSGHPIPEAKERATEVQDGG